MAVKYSIRYRSYDETLWQVDISPTDYTGPVIDVLGSADNACKFEYDGGVDDPFDNPFVTCKADIQFINEGQIDMDELQQSGDRDVIISVYRNLDLKFMGRMIVDQIQQPMQYPPYVARITAIDGLNMLESITFTGLGSVTSPAGAAVRCPLNFLRLCLCREQNLGILLPIRWHISLKNKMTNDDALAGLMTWSPYGDGIIAGYNSDGTAIYQNCQYIVEGIVKAFGCRIFQADGAWNIMNTTDIIGGVFTYQECSATLGLPTITTHEVDINRLVNGQGEINGAYKYIREDQLITVKPALGYVDVTYDSDRKENILPNGGFDVWSTGFLLYWGFTTNPNTAPTLLQRDSLTGQPGYAVELTNDGTATEPAEFTFVGGLPLDANLLFKRMTFGFTFLPTQYGFSYKNDPASPDTIGEINWDAYPLQLQVSYVIDSLDGPTTYYLNAFGYWQKGEPTGGFFRFLVYQQNTAVTWRYYFIGTPLVGDIIYIELGYNTTQNINLSFTVTEDTAGSLSDTMAAFAAAWSVKFPPDPAVSGANYIEISDNDEIFTPNNQYVVSGGSGLRPGNKLYATVNELHIDDVANVVFQGKGGNSDILIPDPGLLDGNQDPAVGKLYIKFYVNPGQRYSLDEVWVRTDDNNDVYRASYGSGNLKSQQITLGISSSFSGFMVSNMMRSYHQSNEDFIWTDGATEASLTEHYARQVMRWRYKPSRIFNGTISTRGRDWSFLEIYQFSGLSGQYLPLKATHNTETNEVVLVAMEGRNDDTGITVQHYASNDLPLSNYGG